MGLDNQKKPSSIVGVRILALLVWTSIERIDMKTISVMVLRNFKKEIHWLFKK